MEVVPHHIMGDSETRKIERTDPIDQQHRQTDEDDKHLIVAERKEQSCQTSFRIGLAVEALIIVTVVFDGMLAKYLVEFLHSGEESNEGIFVEHPAVGRVLYERHEHQTQSEAEEVVRDD
jgi:hypothetical protein